jgi:hypothetical protein
VLVGEDQPDRAQPELADLRSHRCRGLALLGRVQAVLLDEPRRSDSETDGPAGHLSTHVHPLWSLPRT